MFVILMCTCIFNLYIIEVYILFHVHVHVCIHVLRMYEPKPVNFIIKLNHGLTPVLFFFNY